MTTLLIRADASPSIGTGHVMRCLALAQAWKEHLVGSHVVFVTADNVPALESRLIEEGILIERLPVTPGSAADMSDTARFALAHGVEWIVLDGYLFSAEFQLFLKQRGFRILFLDDYGHAAHYHCDLILNQNISAQSRWYISREPYTKMLLGSRYVLLGREFWSWRSWTREPCLVARRMLLTMGGADPAAATERALDAVELLEDETLEIKLVIGAANQRRNTLLQRAQASHLHVEVVSSALRMADLMVWADIAISAAGSTVWELLFMQVPTVAISTAANQIPAARYLNEVGATVSFELESLNPVDLTQDIQRLISSDQIRAKMAISGRKIVDGEGARRVVDAMQSNGKLALRQAKLSDCQLLWKWVNEAEVRRVSFHQDPIPWETHVEWLKAKLDDHSAMLFIAEYDRVPVGQIRYEMNGLDALVSISLDQKMRGKGLSSMLIMLGSEQVFLKTKVESIHAYIRPENRGSIRAFQNARFHESSSSDVRGTEALHFIQQRKALNKEGP